MRSIRKDVFYCNLTRFAPIYSSVHKGMMHQSTNPLFLLTAQCVHGFYPMEYLDLLRLSGRAGLDSEEYFSKDVTSRHDEATREDYLPAETRHLGDYSNPESEYSRDYDSRDFETQTFSSLFEKPPQENDALYSSPKFDRFHKREEYFGELSKKSISGFHRPRKESLHSPEDLMAGASGPNFNQPRSRTGGRSRRARLSDYDLYYPKRRYPEDSSVEYRSKPVPSPKPYDEYSSDYAHRNVDDHEQPSVEPAYPAEAYTRAPYHETHSKPIPKPSRKSYPRAPVKSNERVIPPSPNYSRQKTSEGSSSIAHRPLKLERDFPEKYRPRKFSEKQARAPYEEDDEEEDFRGKPLISTTSWSKPKRQPKHFSDENKHYLAATGYGKPVREQFHEQGTTGPHAYKFGYNTGDPENPMARYEERDPDGLVKGSYSYVDPMGKLQVVHYESHPEHGFKTSHA